MNRALLIAIILSLVPWTSTANAQDFDPKEAIVGAWMVDAEALFTQLTAEADPEQQQMLMMAGGMMMKYILEIRSDGSFLMGGVEIPIRYLFEVDDDGLLWMVQKDGNAGSFFNGIRFDDPDHFVMLPNPGRGTEVEITFARVFPSGMLEEGVVDPDAELVITGFWTIDKQRLQTMPWLESITDQRYRQSLLGEALSKTEGGLIGFVDGGLCFYSNEYHKVDRMGEYTIRAADGKMIALSVLIDRGPDSESPLLRIDLHDENHIDILMTYLAPGPIPMVRSHDVTLP